MKIFIYKNGLIMKKEKTNIFIEKARKIHGDKYYYSKVEYINNKTKVCIICPEHGEFWQVPCSHLNKHGCPKCGGTERMTTEEFIKQSEVLHQNKYFYDKVKYVNSNTKVCIICPIHGEFWQTPHNHLNGCGCPKCGGTAKLTTEEFIEKARKIHGDKYDYSNVNYIDAHTKVHIICPEHGEFWQTPHNHLNGKKCKKCGSNEIWNIRGRITTEEFIEKARKIHGDKYDYSKAEYVNERTPVCIICNKKYKKTDTNHGEFYQTPIAHLSGNGCPKCRNSQLENKIYSLFYFNKIKFQKEKTFEWLKNRQNLYLDFYLPDYNIAIECQGIQHFIPLKRGKMTAEKAEKKFENIRQNDLLKQKLCQEHNIKIVYFTNKTIFEKWNNNIFENIHYDENNLLKIIENERENDFCLRFDGISKKCNAFN